MEHDPSTAKPEAGTPGKMRAIVQHRYGTDPGSVLEVGQVPQPAIAGDEVLVRVAAASVDMGTWHCMTGMPYAMRLAGFGLRAPKAPNPGRALAGTVTSVGSEVSAFHTGDAVYGTCDGSFAEFARVAVGKLAVKPVNSSFEEAAAAPISGVTALQAVRKADVRSGQHVLVVGASGGVGAFAVQIAKARGAEVTGVCSTGKVQLVESLGADHVIDYTADDFTEGGERYDVILDTGGNRRLSDLRRALTEHGTLVIVGGETGGRWLGGFQRSLAAVLLSVVVSQKLIMLTSKENGEDLGLLGELVEAGQVTPALDRTFSLDRAPEAISRVRAGDANGKVIVVP